MSNLSVYVHPGDPDPPVSLVWQINLTHQQYQQLMQLVLWADIAQGAPSVSLSTKGALASAKPFPVRNGQAVDA